MPEDNFEHLPDIDMGADFSDLMDENQGEPPASNEEAAAQESSTQKSDSLELDGELIPIEQAREWLSKGRDATKKWQEAADLKREADAQLQRVQWVDELERAWSQGPDSQRAVIESLQRLAGFEPTSSSHLPPQLNADDLSDEGRFLVEQNAGLRKELSQVRQQMAKAVESMERYVRDQQGQDTAHQTATRLKSEWGVDVQPQQLREAAKRQGIEDLEAAWLKENKALLRNLAPGEKPKSPGGKDKTFDPNDPKLSVDKMFKLLMQGYEPSS